MAKVKLAHIPYKGGSESAVAVASGQVDLSFVSLAATLPLLESKRTRALAVTGMTRAPLLADVPTLDEAALPGYDYTGWYGLLVPSAVPKEIVARLHAAIVLVVHAPEVKEAFARQGLEGRGTTPEQFATFMRAETEKNAKLIKLTGIQAE